ncbi:DUF305 domain-containing protein [Aquisalinus luteolus]|uniref:DUF305 domain-containing protein n=1 Tax=Aquisalinus luteolus TaxID=1566827 RepID=A0A8J3ESB2_9PROT|nr:DUF305 domain-containing protein [Aquisalinus luteolus]GGI02091.1 hypothetical protein GCM10011355_34270 [Aquisalinus luteolus]
MNNGSNYLRFAAMIGTSMVVMFILMYFNTYAFEHVRWSETRFYMTFIMGAAMAVVMLSFMLGMYSDKKINAGIYIGSFVVLIAALFLVRSQVTVGERSYMNAMIPHHSIAIMTSERAQIEDVRVRELADEIIRAQRREIKEMEWLVDDIRKNGIAESQEEAEARPVPEFEGKLNPQEPSGSDVE